MAYNWMVPYNQLKDEQKEFVDNDITENVWVQGHAGSGKSIVLIHKFMNALKSSETGVKPTACIVLFTHSLIDMFKTAMKEINAPFVKVMTYHSFMNNTVTYDYIFCDEVQDLPANVLQSMTNRSKRLIVAGDSNQSIFTGRVRIDKIAEIANAKPFKLFRIYRLPRTIIAAVSKLMPNSDIFGALLDMTKVDVNIGLGQASSEKEEVSYISKNAIAEAENGNPTVVLLPTHEDVCKFINLHLAEMGVPVWTPVNNQYGKTDFGKLNRHLETKNVLFEYVGNGYGSFTDANNKHKVILMTYHSSKGMDFQNVYLPFLSSTTYIQDKTLLMVAITRSKQNLVLTYSGFLHDYVNTFSSECTDIPLNKATTINTQNTNDFDF